MSTPKVPSPSTEDRDPGSEIEPDLRRVEKQSLAARAGQLFPTAAPSPMSPGRIVLGYLAGFVLLAIIPILRQSGVPAWNTVWAEDGKVFYQLALTSSVPKALVAIYAGYPQLFPRIMAEMATLLPVKDLAPYMTFSGAVLLSAIALLVFHASRGHLKSPLTRVILAAAMVFLPLATGELLDNVVNIQWWLFFATFWMLLWRPRTVAGQLIAAVTCFLAVSSNPLVGLFLPLALIRLFALRRPSEHAATTGLFAGLVFQAIVVLEGHGQSIFSPTFVGVPKSLLLRVGLGWLTGRRLTSQFISLYPTQGMVLGAVLLVGLAVFVISSRDVRVRLFGVIAMVFAIITFAVPIWLRGVGPLLEHLTDWGYSRYAETPILLLVSMLLIRLESLPPNQLARWTVPSVALSLVVLVPFWAWDFRDSDLRTAGPAWSAQVTSAVRTCAAKHRYLYLLGLPPESGTATLQISGGPQWQVVVPCNLIQRQAIAPVPTSMIRVLHPATKATLTGTTVLEAAAPGASSVKFRILGGSFRFNDPVLCSATLTPEGWRCDWDSATVPNGAFELRAVAVNAAGLSYGASIDVIVKNPPAA